MEIEMEIEALALGLGFIPSTTTAIAHSCNILIYHIISLFN